MWQSAHIIPQPRHLRLWCHYAFQRATVSTLMLFVWSVTRATLDPPPDPTDKNHSDSDFTTRRRRSNMVHDSFSLYFKWQPGNLLFFFIGSYINGDVRGHHIRKLICRINIYEIKCCSWVHNTTWFCAFMSFCDSFACLVWLWFDYIDCTHISFWKLTVLACWFSSLPIECHQYT